MTDLQLTGDGSVIDNIAYMERIADEILPDYEYSRELLDEEIEHERIKYAEQGIKIEQILEEKKRVMDEINARLKVRICDVSWMEMIVNSCKMVDIPVFVKQMGTFIAKQEHYQDHHGGDIEEFPLTLQVRQFPQKSEST